MARKPVSATVMVKAAICYKCSNYASVTLIGDNHTILQCCPEHHIERFQQMLIERVRDILDWPELQAELATMDGLAALARIRIALLGPEVAPTVVLEVL